MARVYEINGEWKSWNYMHDHLGYTRVPTTLITYKSANPETWGEDTSDDGYYTNGETSSEYFVNGKLGWWSLDGLSNVAHLMPSFCETDDLYFSNGVTLSVAALFEEIEPEEDRVYLIAAVMNLGWKTLAEWQELGWDIAVADVALFGGDFYGNKITMESVDGGGSLIDKYAHYKALFELRGWSPGGDFTEYQAIGGILTGTSDNVMWVKAGSMGGVIDEYVPVPENPTMYVNLGLRWDAGNTPASWLSKMFHANDWWWSGILSYDDKAALESFGNSIISYTSSDYNWAGQIGALHYEPGHFSYELVDMFSDVGSGSVPFDPTNFYFDRHSYPPSGSTQYRGCMRIWAINAFNTLVKTYRVKITNNFPNDTNSTFILLGMKFNSSNSEWVNVTFATIDDDGWWAGILDLTDQTKIAQLNLIENTSYPFGEVLYSPNYDYEVVGVYTDFGNTLLPGFDPANFYVAKAANYNVICIYSHTVISIPALTWCCKITPKAPSDSATGTISALWYTVQDNNYR